MNDLKKIREKVSSLRALVVDDEDELRESIIMFMKKFFTNVDGAQNGKIALEMLKEDDSYGVVLSDIRMPKMTGWDLAEEIRSLDRELFIAIMTGSPEVDGEDRESCDIYLPKPIDITSMRLMLEAIIKKKGL